MQKLMNKMSLVQKGRKEGRGRKERWGERKEVQGEVEGRGLEGSEGGGCYMRGKERG